MTADDPTDDRREEPDDEYDADADDVDAADDEFEESAVDAHDESDFGSDPVDDSSDDRTDVPIDEESAGDRGSDDGSERDDRDENRSRIDVSTGSGGDRGDRNGTDRGDPADGESDHWLSSLLSALERLESGGSMSGRRRSDRTVLDYDISISSGDDLGDGPEGLDRNPFGGDDDPRRDRDRRRIRRRRSSPSSDHHLTTRRDEGELLVTADVAGADPDDVTVGFNDDTLVVAVAGSEVDRIDVPWRDREAEAAINNGVLTVHIESASSDDAGSDADGTAATEGDDE